MQTEKAHTYDKGLFLPFSLCVDIFVMWFDLLNTYEN